MKEIKTLFLKTLYWLFLLNILYVTYKMFNSSPVEIKNHEDLLGAFAPVQQVIMGWCLSMWVDEKIKKS